MATAPTDQLIYFLYGLSFFSLGLCLAVRVASAASFRAHRRVIGIAAFGLLHGVYEWTVLAEIAWGELIAGEVKYGIAAASFLPLIYFSLARSGTRPAGLAIAVALPTIIWVIAAVFYSDPVVLEVITRLVLGVPASLSAGYVLICDPTLRPASPKSDNIARIAGTAFLIYAGLQLFSSTGDFFPASVLNTSNFADIVGVQCVLIRTFILIIITASMITLLGGFDWAIRRRTEQQLRESNRRLKQAQRIANIGSWEWNIVTNDLVWSDQIFRIFGLNPQEFGASYPAFLACVHPDDRAYVEESVRRATEERAPYSIDHRIVLPDGEIRTVHEQGEVEFSPTGKPLRMLGTVQDMTSLREIESALRRSEETLSGILKISPEAIIVADANMQVSLFSDGAQEIFGYSAEEVVGCSVQRLIPERFRKNHQTHIREFRESGVISRKMGERTEIIGLRKNGEEFPAEASLSRLDTPNGPIFTTILHDITHQKAARTELLDARLKAEAASEAKSRFIANMSHELRTPLNAIIGFSQLLMDETLWSPDKKRQRRYVDDIYSSGNHLLNLINEILDISRIEVGAIQLNEETTEIDQVIESCVTMVHPKAAAAGIRIKQVKTDDLPPVWVDCRLLTQAVLNLLSNAVKFTPKDGDIEISAGRDQRGGMTVAIRDTGIGMSDEQIGHVGHPFVQADSDLNRRYEGAGLGLAITKGLITLHDGELMLESTPGKGTSVFIHLPADRVLNDRVGSAAD